MSDNINMISHGHDSAGGALCHCGHRRNRHIGLDSGATGASICLVGECGCYEFEAV